MTTIAIKDGIVAYDSRVTQEYRVLDDNFDKRRERDGVQFFIAGNMTDDEAVMEGYFGGKVVDTDVVNEEMKPNADFIITDGMDVYYGGLCEDGFWKMELTNSTPYAIGSGAAYALGAMDTGATAKQAIKAACRDVFTGGTIRTYRIK